MTLEQFLEKYRPMVTVEAEVDLTFSGENREVYYEAPEELGRNLRLTIYDKEFYNEDLVIYFPDDKNEDDFIKHIIVKHYGVTDLI